MEFLTKDTHLDYSEDNTTFSELYGLTSYPDMGSEPDKQEVTNMRDSNKRYIAGLQDPGTLGFEFFYNNGEEVEGDENVEKNAFAKLKELNGKKLYWRLVYPDGTGYKWQGSPNAYIKGGSVNAPMSFALSVSLESSLDFVEDIEGTTP